jgi:alcohol dehydrogenase class IV
MPHTLEGVEGFDASMAKALAPLAAADPSLATNPKPCSLDELEAVFIAAWRGDLG